ncbi:hypothetical protein [Natronobiforma cellulositropha]|uniref:hypothetical protein n=1 Tax=Natronobiforma cellulositropha TaxID=1679076 RepID=UPI0021D60989|nr:hypothetical protein [Natronobiforma cellulositropha]
MHTRRVQAALDEFAADAPYEALARTFLEFERPGGTDPLLLLVDAASSSAGSQHTAAADPAVERFREAYLETDSIRTFADLAALSPDDAALVETLRARRSRHVLLETARVFAARPEDDDFSALRSWAAEATLYTYDSDPVGSISGVGPASFQYLRMLAGVDTATPDASLERFVTTLADALETPALDASSPLRTVASCEWLSLVTSYRLLELDRLAWWLDADERERDHALASLAR